MERSFANSLDFLERNRKLVEIIVSDELSSTTNFSRARVKVSLWVQ